MNPKQSEHHNISHYHPIHTAIQSHEVCLKVLTKIILANNSNYLNKVLLTQYIVLFTFF